MKLAQYQKLFLRSVSVDEAPAELVAEVNGGGALDATTALSVYRSMYWYRLVDAHFSLLPRTARVLGGKRFTELVCACLAKHPSTVPVLERLATPFAHFLESEAQVGCAASELASLEAAQIESLLSPDPHLPLLSRDDTQRSEFASLKVLVHPSTKFCEARPRALALYESTPIEGEVAEAGVSGPEPEDGDGSKKRVLFYRRGFAIAHRVLDDGEEIFATGRATIEDVLVALAGPDSDAARAFARLAWWIDHRQLSVQSLEPETRVEGRKFS